MLTEQERNEIEEEARKYPFKGAVGIEALKIVQKHRGWVSVESLREVAHYLGITSDELESVSSSYNLILRKPVGRHLILVCDSVSCWIMGSEQIQDHLTRRLGVEFGQTTADGRFTVLPSACLGACDQAPAMMVDDELYVNLDPEKIDGILEKYK
jgi:NADH-quinone oxidoreductase subunit E